MYNTKTFSFSFQRDSVRSVKSKKSQVHLAETTTPDLS